MIPTPEQQAHLKHFLDRVAKAGLPLVSYADRSRLEERHLAPSLAGLDLLPETGRILDIGSGGGFPAIPLAILTPHLSWTLVESNQRKAAFLTRVSRETALEKGLIVLNQRVEELTRDKDSLYDAITARAVTDLPQLAAWTRSLLAKDGFLLFWKGRDWRHESWPEAVGLKLITELKLTDGSVLLKLEVER
ncbi:16S rRNA (guanine(527)-N(7))-methyltransferase RsmG [bacterium]|nr:16S rRNA (guanine(527)-N(7))-methyltransferase RsmG [bacterium]